MNLTDEYKLSFYTDEKLIKETDLCVVSLVRSSVDGKNYIKKEYTDNKSDVYSVLQKINSPYLPKVADIIDGRTVIEEHIDGVTLEQKLAEGKLSERQIKRIEKQLLCALSVLHDNGIVHRDVKLSNVIIKPDGTAVLIDFGIAKRYKPQADKDTALFGTVGYAPPEQFGFAPADYRSDVYSFGVTASKLGSKSYKKIISRCKAFDPDRRYANAGEVITAIRRLSVTRVSVLITAAVLIAAACFVVKWFLDKPPAIDNVVSEPASQTTTAEPTTEESLDSPTTQPTSEEILDSSATQPTAEAEITVSIKDDAAARLIEDYEDANGRLYIYDFAMEEHTVSYPTADEVQIDAKIVSYGVPSDLTLKSKLDRSEFSAQFSHCYFESKIFRQLIGTFIPDYDDYKVYATAEDEAVREQLSAKSRWTESGTTRTTTVTVRGYEVTVSVFDFDPNENYFAGEVRGRRLS